MQLCVYYEDNESYLSELVGRPKADGGFVWEGRRLTMNDGKTFQVLKESAISATSVKDIFHVFFVASRGEIIHAFWTSAGWNWKVVAGDN